MIQALPTIMAAFLVVVVTSEVVVVGMAVVVVVVKDNLSFQVGTVARRGARTSTSLPFSGPLLPPGPGVIIPSHMIFPAYFLPASVMTCSNMAFTSAYNSGETADAF